MKFFLFRNKKESMMSSLATARSYAYDYFNIEKADDGHNYITYKKKDDEIIKRISLPCDDDSSLVSRLNIIRENYVKDRMKLEGYDYEEWERCDTRADRQDIQA